MELPSKWTRLGNRLRDKRLALERHPIGLQGRADLLLFKKERSRQTLDEESCLPVRDGMSRGGKR
jgi:hypothetical protein